MQNILCTNPHCIVMLLYIEGIIGVIASIAVFQIRKTTWKNLDREKLP